MSNEPFRLNCRWGARSEDARACAGRLAMMLSSLVPLHPAFAHWNQQGDTRAEANSPFCAMPPRVDELMQIFEENYLSPGEPMLGFSLSAWNGNETAHALSLKINAGSDTKYSIFPNYADIGFRHYETANADLVTIGVLKPALLALVTAWTPAWADVSPWGYFKRWRRADPWDDEDRKGVPRDGYIPSIRAGWMTYLCPDYARRITRPPGVDVEPVAGGGALLIATREVFTPGNPAHDAAADSIQNALLPLQNLPSEAMMRGRSTTP